MNSPLLWLHLPGCVILVYVICSSIDFGRAKLFNAIGIEKLVHKLSRKINALFEDERQGKKNG